MKFPILAAGLIASIAFAVPAEAAKKRKSGPAAQPAVALNDPDAVVDFSGRLAGRDPDPNIRAMIRKDPRPWEGTN